VDVDPPIIADNSRNSANFVEQGVNIPPGHNSVKDIWNSRQSNVWNHSSVQNQVCSTGGIWGNNSDSTDTATFPLQLPKFESLFNETDSSLNPESFSKKSSILNSKSAFSAAPGQNREPDFSADDNEPHTLLGGGRITGSGFSSVFGTSGSSALSNLAKSGTSDKKSAEEESESASQRLLRGFCPSGLFNEKNQTSGKPHWDEMRQLEANQQRKIIEDFQQRVWKLTSDNNDLLKQLAEKEAQSKQFFNLESKYRTLESKHEATTSELAHTRHELETLRAQVGRHRNEQGNSSLTNGDFISENEVPAEIKTKLESDRDVIILLNKKLEMEQLRSRNLTQELQIERDAANRKSGPPGLTMNHPRQLSRQPGSVPLLGLGAPGMDEDPFGLRRMMQTGPMNPSGGLHTAGSLNPSMNPAGPLNPATSMFGPIIGPEFTSATHQPINKSTSASSIGLPGPSSDPVRPSAAVVASVTGGNNRSSHTPSPAGSISPPPSVPPTSSFQPAFSQQSQLFNQPPPATPAVTSSAPPAVTAAATTKIARQEQLVKKLVSTIPGSSENQIRQYIQVLRIKHGKLSGWPTSKIASHIADLMKNEQTGYNV